MLGPYRALLKVPGALQFAVPAFFARLPMSMLGLGVVVLLSTINGSYGLAGAVSATLTCASALGAPLLGVLVDRLGQRRVVVPAMSAHGAALAALIALSLERAPTWALFVSAALAGMLLPPVSSMVRARWTNLLGAGTTAAERAYAFEAIVDELVFMSGPVLVTTLAATASASGLVCSGVFALVGGWIFAMQRRTEPTVAAPEAHASHGSRSALGVPGVRVLAVTCAVVGLVFGTIDVSMVAFATAHGHRALSGVLLALVACGSGASGVWYGSRVWSTTLRRRLVIACGTLALTMSSLPFAPGIAVMAPLAFVAGLAISPTLIACFALVERLVPRRLLTEGLTWVTTSLGLGVGAGVTISGRIVDAFGVSHALFLCPCAAVAAGVLAISGRAHLAAAIVDGGTVTA